MATKKKIFDAVAASRRWRIASGKRLGKMTFAEQQAHLERVTREFFSRKPKYTMAELEKLGPL
jgi:hypothetical protein